MNRFYAIKFGVDYPIVLSTQLRQHLRSLRKARGLTQADLAARLGVVQSRVADIEADPSAVSVEQLLKVLTILNAQLVVRDSDPTPGLTAQDMATSSGKATLGVEGAVNSPPPADLPPKGQW